MKKTCRVCMHHCKLEPGQTGICRARKNIDGKITCINYGQITSIALDAIEKKPLRMFFPGSKILSVGSFGCNLRCPFCQNHEISMADANMLETMYLSPSELTEMALQYKERGNIGVAYTYNEPLVGWEYVRDTAKLVKMAGMKNVLVTNGTIEPIYAQELLPYIDAVNIDLKGGKEAYYRKLGGDMKSTMAFIALAARSCHVELTMLIVPGENDDVRTVEKMAEWIAYISGLSGKEIPLHITRFFPRYHMTDKGATDVELLHILAHAARKHLKNVFIGNC